jgi:hypothetical protein
MTIAGEPSFLQITGQSVDLTKNSSSDIMKLAFSVISIDGSSSAVPDEARVVVEFSNSDGTQYSRMQVDAKDSVYRLASNRYLSVEKRLDELFYTSGQFSWQNVSIVKAYAATIKYFPITRKELADNVATITTSASNKVEVDDYVSISGVDETFNGIHKVTQVIGPETFTYDKVADDVADQIVLPNGKLEAPDRGFYVALDALRVDNISTVNPLYGLTGYSIIQNLDEVTITKSPNTNNYIEYRFVLDVT